MWWKPAPDALPPLLGVKQYFKIQDFSFASIGMDPTTLEKTMRNPVLCLVPMLSILTLNIAFVITAMEYVRDLDMVMVTDALSPFWQGILCVLKWFCFMGYRQRIIILIRKIWYRNLEANAEELKLIIDANRKDTIFSTYFYGMVFLTGVVALVAPFFMSYYLYTKGQGFWKTLEPPLKAAYFLDTKTIPGYIVAYVWNLVGIYFVINGNLSTDSLYSWFMANISTHFQILGLKFKKLADLIENFEDDQSIKYQRALIACIQHHREVIELANEFNRVFRVTVFIKFTISFAQIACLAFQAVKGGDMASQVFKFFFLVSVSSQLILYCYGGQKIKDESTAVSLAIYECFHWHNMSIKSKKLLLLPMLRAQKPCDLTGVFFVADLSLFLWVFKMAGSFITMLLTLEEK